jgi:foldase protein PrsA
LPKKDDELAKAQPAKDSASKPAAKPKTVKSESAEKPVVKTDSKPVEKAATVAEPKAEVKPVVASTTTSTDKSVAGKRGKFRLPTVSKALATKIGVGLLALIVLAVIVFGVLIYGYQNESAVVKAVSAVVPYPAERVNGSFISYHEYLFQVDANKMAYQNNAKLNNQPAVDFKSADGKKLVKQIKTSSLDKLKSDTVTAQLAQQKKVKVTSKDVDALLNQLYERYGGKDTLLKTLKQVYGWNINDLKKVVRTQLIGQKLQEKVTSDPAADATAKSKATDLAKQAKAGADFTELAKKNSQASDASSGGDLGTFGKGQLPDDVQKAVDALQPDQISDPIKTQYGYEIFKLISRDGDNTHAAHILVETVDYTNYFNEQLKKAKTNVYIKVK